MTPESLERRRTESRVAVRPGEAVAALPAGGTLRVFRSVGSSAKAGVEDVEVPLGALQRPALLEGLEPYRQIVSRPWSRGRVRWQPVLSLRRSMLCESRQEALRIIELDRSGDLSWLVTQPFSVEWLVGDRAVIRHVPDLLYSLGEGAVVLENVRPGQLRDEKYHRQAALARELCDRMGWSYADTGDWPGASAEVLWYLRAYAVVTPRDEVVEKLEAAFSEREVWRLADLRSTLAIDAAEYPTLMHLIWRGEIVTNLELPLTFASRLRWGGLR